MKSVIAIAATVSGLAASSVLAETKVPQDKVCKAAVAAIMGRDAKIIKIDKQDGAVTHLSYVRPNDGTLWKYRCKLEGNRVIWASDTGRWRTDPLDEEILFKVDEASGVTITQEYTDGSKDEDHFSAKVLAGK